MGRDDDDRPRKSWRELDRQKDSSAHHGSKSRGYDRPDNVRSSEYRSYKSQLNKIFDGGGLPDALKERLEGTEVGQEAKAKKEALQAVIDAKTPAKIAETFAAYRTSYDFPENEDVLAKLLELEDEEVVLQAIETIEKLHDEGALKRSGSLKARIKTAQMTVDDDDVFSASKRVLKKL